MARKRGVAASDDNANLSEKSDGDENARVLVISDEMLKDIPPEQRQIVRTVVRRAIVSYAERYSGPIPHPKIIKGYEDILPGSGDRILRMAEDEQQHSHTIEIASLGAAFLVTAALSFGSIWLISIGAGLTGLGPVVIAIGSLVGVFLFGRRE